METQRIPGYGYRRQSLANPVRVTVTFPQNWADEPMFAGHTVQFYYRTHAIAREVRAGFRARGCRAD